MAKFRKMPCAYCGTQTGKNEREHVIPFCLYPSTTPSNFQRATVPACPKCNGSWEADESHFKTIVAMAGLTLTPERVELLAGSHRSFARPVHGTAAFEAIWRQMIASPILNRNGKPWYKLRPQEDERVSRVIRKIVRGLVWRERRVALEDSRIRVMAEMRLPDSIDRELEIVYTVPQVFTGRATFFDGTLMWRHLHSFWVLQFFADLRICAVATGPEPEAPLPDEPTAQDRG